jgi:hypothetical protein
MSEQEPDVGAVAEISADAEVIPAEQVQAEQAEQEQEGQE